MKQIFDSSHKDLVERIARRIGGLGGRAMYVGGMVRDSILGLPPQDVDIEVYCLELEHLEQALGEFGVVRLTGRQFGVLRLDGLEVEWSVPRSDSRGRHPAVALDPCLSFREASRRRDLTMNAMLRDVLSGEPIDPWEGQKDIRDRILRTPDPELFVQDPLRFYRVMQFAARFEMTPDESLQATCRGMDISAVSRERVEEEFEKLWLLAGRPSLGLRWLESTGRLAEILPELAALKDTSQDPEWHPEGDVWRHTLQVVDAAAALRTGNHERDLMLLWAALLHDAGKPSTTIIVDGRVRSPEHDQAGAELAARVLDRLAGKKSVRAGAVKLVAQHMKPLQFHQNNSPARAFKRLALKLHPEADLELLASLSAADYRGTNPDSDLPFMADSPMIAWFREMSRESLVEKGPEKPVLLGRHLIGMVEPGPDMGRLLEEAYRIQLDEGLSNWRELRRRVLDNPNAGVDNSVPDN